jgi:hypothetical protein
LFSAKRAQICASLSDSGSPWETLVNTSGWRRSS